MSRQQGEGCSHWNYASFARDGKNVPRNNPNKADWLRTNNNSMKRLRDSILGLASSRITHPPTKETTLRMNALLCEIFSVNNTPDNPPYQEMIYEAIEALNKEGGSSDEASISAYIKSHYHHYDLPMGHDSLLSHHLALLSAKGDIVIMDSIGYHKLVSLMSIPNLNNDEEEVKLKEVKKRRGRPSKKEKKFMVYGRKRRRGRPKKQID